MFALVCQPLMMLNERESGLEIEKLYLFRLSDLSAYSDNRIGVARDLPRIPTASETGQLQSGSGDGKGRRNDSSGLTIYATHFFATRFTGPRKTR